MRSRPGGIASRGDELTTTTIEPIGSGSDDDDSLAGIVRAAADGHRGAWNELVRRYSSLITAIARRYRLDAASVDDVGQVVWTRCYTSLTALRNPAAMPGWLKTMAHREALRLATAQSRFTATDPADLERMHAGAAVEDPSWRVLRSEANQVVRDGLAELTPDQRRLLIVLHSGTGVPYQELSRTLGMPTGSIGPTRARCLAKLRRTSALQRDLNPQAEPA